MQRTTRLSDAINQYARMIDGNYVDVFELWPESKAELRIWRMHFNLAIAAFRRLFELIMCSATANEQNAHTIAILLRDTFAMGHSNFLHLFFPGAPPRATWYDFVKLAEQTKFIFLDNTSRTLPLL